MRSDGSPDSSVGGTSPSRPVLRTAWFIGAVGAAAVVVIVVVATWGVPGSGPSVPLSCERTWQSTPVTSTPVKHLFVIVNENHAFENFFGTLPGVAGDPPNGSFPVSFQSSATVEPFPI